MYHKIMIWANVTKFGQNYRLVFSWLNEYKVTVKILKVAVNNSYLKVTVKHISIAYH